MRLAVLLGFILAASITIGAQGEAPKCDELCLEYITGVVLAAQAEKGAQDSVQQLVAQQAEAWKTYDALRKQRTQLQNDRTAKIEKKYPGYTIDWSKRVLVPKPSAGK